MLPGPRPLPPDFSAWACHLWPGADVLRCMINDTMNDPLGEYARTGSAEAFRCLVEAHFDTVYSQCLRQLRIRRGGRRGAIGLHIAGEKGSRNFDRRGVGRLALYGNALLLRHPPALGGAASLGGTQGGYHAQRSGRIQFLRGRFFFAR